jgi:hypothetical protein
VLRVTADTNTFIPGPELRRESAAELNPAESGVNF